MRVLALLRSRTCLVHVLFRFAAGLGMALPLLAISAYAQPASDAFHWVDFHDPKDAPFVTWVNDTMKAEKWTAIREIGVQWDSALVITSERSTPQSAPPADVYTLWSVSLSSHEAQPLLHASSPRLLNWTNFAGAYSKVPELGVVYQDCYGCDAPSTFFTTLYYNLADHAWRARWVRGDQTLPLWSTGTLPGVTRTQVYGLLTEPAGRNVIVTWSHFDYGSAKPAEDYVYEYGVEPSSGLEQTVRLDAKDAEEMKRRVCHQDAALNQVQTDPSLAQLSRGQDSDLCRDVLLTPLKARPGSRSGASTPGRRPATGPPPNNQGQSVPPRAMGSKPDPKLASKPN